MIKFSRPFITTSFEDFESTSVLEVLSTWIGFDSNAFCASSFGLCSKREFIKAAEIVKQQNKNVQFWLIGEIDKENPSSVRNEDLMKWIRDPIIHYHGATENIRKYIEKSDCIVLPSYREGMPKVIMESMAMERAVITTDTAGCRETVDENINGYLVPVKDSAALAKAMLRFISLDKKEQTQMGKAGRMKVLKEFDDRIIADNLYASIEDFL